MFATVQAIGLAVVVAAGGFGRPSHADWSPLRIMEGWAGGGGLQLTGIDTHTLVGQLALAWPVASLDPSVARLHLLTISVALAGAVVLYRLLRQVTDPMHAAISSTCALAGPLVASLNASFASDDYAFLPTVVCLWCGARALTTDGRTGPWIAAAMAAGVGAFSVRQVTLAAPIAVIAAVALRGRASFHGRAVPARTVLIAGAGTLLAVVALSGWRAQLENDGSEVLVALRTDAGLAVRSSVQTLFTLAMLALPGIVLSHPVAGLRRAWRHHRRATAVVLLTVAATAAVLMLASPDQSVLLPERFLADAGTLGRAATLSGDPEPLVPPAIWFVVQAAAVLATASIALALVRAWPTRSRLRHAQPVVLLLTLFAAAMVLVILGATLAGRPPFDRYLLPLVPLVAAGALKLEPKDEQGAPLPRHAGAMAATWVGIGAWLAFGFAFSSWEASQRALRWDASERVASEQRADPRSVDGGIDWVGYHARTPYDEALSATGRNPSWYASAFADVDTCWVVVEGAPPVGADLEPMFTIRSSTLGVERRINVHRLARCAGANGATNG